MQEALKHVQVSLILTDDASWISSFVVHWRNNFPAVLKDIEHLTLCYHFSTIVLPTDYVNVSVTKIVMSSEATSSPGDAGQSFNCVVEQVELKDIADYIVMLCGVPIIMLFGDFWSWDDDHSIVWNINCSAEGQSFVQSLTLNILHVRRMKCFPVMGALDARV